MADFETVDEVEAGEFFRGGGIGWGGPGEGATVVD